MSIFKRFSGKKSGGKAASQEELVLDEQANLTEEEAELPLPASDDDAFPSLKGFSEDEQKVIRSILADQKTPRNEPEKEIETLSELAAETESIAEESRKKWKSRKSIDDILSDNSYKSALSILKGDVDIDPPTLIQEDYKIEETELPDLIDDFEAVAESSQIEDILEDQGTEDQNIDDLQAEEEPEIEITASSDFDETLTLEEEDMTSEIETETDIETEIDQEVEPIAETASDTDLDIQSDIRSGDIATSQRRINLGEMRMDVANIMSDIESGDSMYRRAQQRVETLTGFIQRAEVDFSLLDRLEPENRALKSENLTLHSELEKRKSKVSQLTSSLEDLQRRYGDTQSELDSAHSKLAQAIKNHERADRDISDLNAQLQEVRLKSDRMRNDMDVENRENGNLRSRIADISSQLDQVTSEKLSFAKQIETLKIDVSDQTENRLKLRDEVGDLRYTLDEAQRQNTKMRGEISGVHEDIRGFKTQYEFNILKRDERIADLEAKIVELNDRVRSKEEIIETTTRDISVLRKERTTQDLERERLEKSVQDVHSQLSRTEDELLRSQKTASELDIKYRDVEAALAHAENLRRSSLPADRPDIAPPPMPNYQTSSSNIVTDDIAISAQRSSEAYEAPQAERIAPNPQITDDIEDLLTDYKLGLRNLG